MWKYPYDISLSESCFDKKFKWSERRDPDNFASFLPQEWFAWEIPEIVLNAITILESVDCCKYLVALHQ